MFFSNIEDVKIAWEAAETLRSQGDFVGAYDRYCEILSTLCAQHLPQWSHDITAQIIQAVAHFLSSIGDFERADNLLQDLVKIYQKNKNYAWANFTIIKRIELELDRANFGQVAKLSESLAQISTLGDISPSGLIQWEISCLWDNADISERSILFAHLYLVLGRSASADGQYRDALIFLERGLWHTRDETPALARQIALFFHFSIASAYLEQGELDKAVAKLADPNTTNFDPDFDPEFQIRWLEMTAKISLLRGELGQALAGLKQVREICQKLGLARAYVRSILNLAEFLISINQTKLAKEYLTQVLSQGLAKREPELKNRGELLLNLADARSESLVSDISGGISLSKLRFTITNTSNDVVGDRLEDINSSFRSLNYLVQFEFRALEFRWLLSCDKLKRANQSLSLIQSAFESYSDSQLIKIKVKILIGTLVYYQGVKNQNPECYKYAASILDELRPDLDRMGLKPDLWQVQRVLGWCCSRLGINKNLQAELRESNKNLLNEFTRSLNSEDGAIYLLNKWTYEEEYIVGEIQKIRQFPLTNSISWKSGRRLPSIQFKYWQQWQLMQKLNELILYIDRYKEALDKQTLEDCHPSYKSSIYSAWQRIFTHPRDRITLIFLVLPDQTLIVRIGWLLFDYHLISTTRLKLRNLVQGWHGNLKYLSRKFVPINDQNLPGLDIDAIKNNNQKISNRLSEILKIDLLLKGLPKRIKSISIIPDDILHGFPFATLLHENKYLIEKYAISVSYSSQNMSYKKSLPLANMQSLLVGISHGTTPLPNVKREIAQVRSWMRHCKLNPLPLMNASADKKTIIKKLCESTFFHIACHGVFYHDQPDLSGLILISKPDQAEEILSLRELSKLDLSNLRHATLSSCWSADNFVLPGRWIISLPETLWRSCSGSASILGCLWEVDDLVAKSFMTNFYDYLEKYKALQLTQQDCLKGRLRGKLSSRNLSNPLYWSGFTLYGDHKKLDLRTRARNNLRSIVRSR
jgi:CHAT domain-containing protein